MTRVGRWANLAAAITAALNGGAPCAGGCGWPVDPAAAAGPDGTPNTYDRHPGCEPGGAHQLIRGEKR